MIAGSQTIADDRRQAIAEVCFHMNADDRRTFGNLRSAIVCDHMETSLKPMTKEGAASRERTEVAKIVIPCLYFLKEIISGKSPV